MDLIKFRSHAHTLADTNQNTSIYFRFALGGYIETQIVGYIYIYI